MLGSGFTKTKEQQLAALSYNVAQTIEGWFLENPQWFAADGAIPGANPNADAGRTRAHVDVGPPVAARPAPVPRRPPDRQHHAGLSWWNRPPAGTRHGHRHAAPARRPR